MIDWEDPDVRVLTAKERAAIQALGRLAKTWPQSLMLASMDGTLMVYLTEDRSDGSGGLDPDKTVATLRTGIPNTGGGF